MEDIQRGVRRSYLVLGQSILNSLCSGLHWSGSHNQFVQPAQQTLQALLDADGLRHSRLQLLGPFGDGRRKAAESLF